MADEKWRVGSKVPINVYEGDRPVCQCQTAIDAARIVEAMNGAERLEVALPDKCPVCGDGGCSNCRIDLAQKRIVELEAALKVARGHIVSVLHRRGCQAAYLGEHGHPHCTCWKRGALDAIDAALKGPE